MEDRLMLTTLTNRREDGTFVGVVNGLPYHVIPGDTHWNAAEAMAEKMGDALPLEPAPPPSPPPTLTARQLRLGLLSLGIRAAQVEEAIAYIPDEMTREVALIEWEYATAFDRNSELVASIGAALGLSESQIDDSWAEFAKL